MWRRACGKPSDRKRLSEWPLPVPRGWKDLVNQPQTEAELETIRRSVARGHPYGNAA
jgi:putative transposase